VSTINHKQPPEGWLTESRRAQPKGPGARAPKETRHTQQPTGKLPIKHQAHRLRPDTRSGRNARRAMRTRVTPAARTFPDATCHHACCTLCHLSQKQAHHAENIHTPRVSKVHPQETNRECCNRAVGYLCEQHRSQKPLYRTESWWPFELDLWRWPPARLPRKTLTGWPGSSGRVGVGRRHTLQPSTDSLRSRRVKARPRHAVELWRKVRPSRTHHAWAGTNLKAVKEGTPAANFSTTESRSKLLAI